MTVLCEIVCAVFKFFIYIFFFLMCVCVCVRVASIFVYYSDREDTLV